MSEISAEEMNQAKRLLVDFPYFCRTFIKIKTKRGHIVPFVLKAQQMVLWNEICKNLKAGQPTRICILKARQLGFSTFMQAFLFWRSITSPGSGGLVVAHKDDSAAELFSKIEMMYRLLPAELYQELEQNRDAKKQGKKLGWAGELNTTLYVDTALNKNVGRSQTFQNAHLSEVGFWDYPDEVMYGLFQSMPQDSIVVVESTANGMGNYFHKLWIRSQKPDSTWTGLFFPWHEEPDYATKPPDNFKPTRDEKKLKKKYNLTNAQLYWRRVKIEDDCDGDEMKFRQEYPASPGEAFIVSGNPYFGARNIEKYMAQTREPLRKGTLTMDSGKPVFHDDDDGPWWIWSRPARGVAYAIGADIAGGTSTDYSAAHILDVNGLEVVATFRGKLDPDEFARELQVMGHTYNDALIAPEKNGEGRATLLKLYKDLGYPRVFYHQFAEDWSGGVQQRYGWITSSKTRPVMLAQLSELVRTSKLKLWCERTVNDMAAFVRVDTSKLAEASEGANDDMVMSLAIACSAETRQLAHLYVDLEMESYEVL